MNLRQIPPVPVNSISPKLRILPKILCLIDIVSTFLSGNSSVSLLIKPVLIKTLLLVSTCSVVILIMRAYKKGDIDKRSRGGSRNGNRSGNGSGTLYAINIAIDINTKESNVEGTK